MFVIGKFSLVEKPIPQIGSVNTRNKRSSLFCKCVGDKEKLYIADTRWSFSWGNSSVLSGPFLLRSLRIRRQRDGSLKQKQNLSREVARGEQRQLVLLMLHSRKTFLCSNKWVWLESLLRTLLNESHCITDLFSLFLSSFYTLHHSIIITSCVGIPSPS